jgi:hypothetical protein
MSRDADLVPVKVATNTTVIDNGKRLGEAGDTTTTGRCLVSRSKNPTHPRHATFYVDRRYAGEERWWLGSPDDIDMRLPDGLLEMPLFFGGKDRYGVPHYRGTAFLVGMPTARHRIGWPCLVTARHNVEAAVQEYGNVWVRANDQGGGAVDIEIRSVWTYPDNPGSDIAITPFPVSTEGGPIPAPPSWFVTDDLIRERSIGIGDDLVVMGLFSSHVGKARNLPIVRSGTLASMPHEPFIDPMTGDEYDAYLAEVRSVGGLSGSPVLVELPPVRTLPVDLIDAGGSHTFYLLGLIRGHWDTAAERDFLESEAGRLNTGIAIVTPITEVLALFEATELVTYGKEMDQQWDEAMKDRGEQVND